MKSVYIDQKTRAVVDVSPIGVTKLKVDGNVIDNVAVITRINVPKRARRRGLGSALIGRVMLDADREDVTLALVPVPYDDETAEFLERWYEALGFKWVEHVTELDQEIEHWMVRRPGQK